MVPMRAKKRKGDAHEPYSQLPHPTPNIQRTSELWISSAFDAGCWMFEVGRCPLLQAPFDFSPLQARRCERPSKLRRAPALEAAIGRAGQDSARRTRAGFVLWHRRRGVRARAKRREGHRVGF